MYEGEKSYYLVNPDGAIHQMPNTLARERLRMPGWRMATKDEITKLFARGGRQKADKPICPKWSPEPPKDQELPDQPMQVKPVKKVKK